MKSKTKKILSMSFIAILLIAVTIGGMLYYRLFSPFFNINETVYVYINERKDYRDLLMQLESGAKIKDVKMFERLASAMNYPEKMKTGRYAVKPEMNCKELLSVLTNGLQVPCNVTFNNIRLKEDLVERIGQQFMFHPGDLLQKLNDPEVCAEFGFNTETILCMFIPNTYEMYWNISVDNFLHRMKKEYDRFWTDERLSKAETIPLSKLQVSILASIVEEETVMKSEYSIVAGLYINRLKRRMLLQADPTVKYAVGDFALRRILNVHLETESPYNTYKHSGLPPGPIRIPSISGLDGVLNYSKHNYIYMCAKEDFSGAHNFATTLAEHNRNADRYRSVLNRNNIR
jgi:UPF0755 protein